MIIQIDDAISAEDRKALIKACRPLPAPAITYPKDVLSQAARALMDRLGTECAQRASQAFDLSVRPEVGAVMLSRMLPGDFLVLHADNCKQDPLGNWVPNHTPQRDFSAAYYLSDDFDGGDLRFPQHELIVKKQSGSLVIFPSDRHHLHEVTPITRGTFFALLVFMEKVNKNAAATLSNCFD